MLVEGPSSPRKSEPCGGIVGEGFVVSKKKKKRKSTDDQSGRRSKVDGDGWLAISSDNQTFAWTTNCQLNCCCVQGPRLTDNSEVLSYTSTC